MFYQSLAANAEAWPRSHRVVTVNMGLGQVQEVQSLIRAEAARFGVPAAIALAVGKQESNFNQAARGRAGEVGVMQLMPATAAHLDVNPFNLRENVSGGVRYLRDMYNTFGDWGTALTAYNGGPGNVQRRTVSAAASRYAAEVLSAAGVRSASVPQLWSPPAGDGSIPAVPAVILLSLGIAIAIAVV